MMFRLVLITIITLFGPALSVLRIDRGMDNILFKPFCARDSVKNMMKECYLAPNDKEINFLGLDTYSCAESGMVTFQEGFFSPNGNRRTTSFRIVSKGTIKLTCSVKYPKSGGVETDDIVKVVPVVKDGVELDFYDIVTGNSNANEKTGDFVNGAVIFYSSDVHISCNWLTIES